MIFRRLDTTFLRSTKASCLVCNEVTMQKVLLYRFRPYLGLPHRHARTLEQCNQCGNRRIALNRAFSRVK
jgi:hypothetical protein